MEGHCKIYSGYLPIESSLMSYVNIPPPWSVTYHSGPPRSHTFENQMTKVTLKSRESNLTCLLSALHILCQAKSWRGAWTPTSRVGGGGALFFFIINRWVSILCWQTTVSPSQHHLNFFWTSFISNWEYTGAASLRLIFFVLEQSEHLSSTCVFLRKSYSGLPMVMG